MIHMTNYSILEEKKTRNDTSKINWKKKTHTKNIHFLNAFYYTVVVGEHVYNILML